MPFQNHPWMDEQVSKQHKHAPLDHKVRSFEFKSETPWTHSAFQIGDENEPVKEYISAHTISHFEHKSNEKAESEIRGIDHDDLSGKIIEIVIAVRPMLKAPLGFEDASELQFAHDEIEIPATKKEVDDLLAVAKHDKIQAQIGKLSYSVFHGIGVSCADEHQGLLEVLTHGSPEEKLAERSLFEKITGITLPQLTAERARLIANARYIRQAEQLNQSFPADKLYPIKQHGTSKKLAHVFAHSTLKTMDMVPDLHISKHITPEQKDCQVMPHHHDKPLNLPVQAASVPTGSAKLLGQFGRFALGFAGDFIKTMAPTPDLDVSVTKLNR